ncbi:hypothetical protein [Corynebacterium sanguinis]
MQTHADEIFVHHQCPHCVSVIKDFNADSGRYGGAELLDITYIRNLKRFLAYRDTLEDGASR